MRLAKDFSPARLEAAAVRALALGTFSYKSLRALISAAPPPLSPPVVPTAAPHEHLRGAEYFQ